WGGRGKDERGRPTSSFGSRKAARSAGDDGALGNRGDAPRGTTTRKYPGGLPGVVRFARGRRSVSRGANARGFPARHLRVVRARESGLDAEEQALLSLLRSWRIRQALAAA